MTEPTDDELAALADALAPLLGLALTPELRPGVLANLRVTLRHAQLVLETPLEEREEPASVYRP